MPFLVENSVGIKWCFSSLCGYVYLCVCVYVYVSGCVFIFFLTFLRNSKRTTSRLCYRAIENCGDVSGVGLVWFLV